MFSVITISVITISVLVMCGVGVARYYHRKHGVPDPKSSVAKDRTETSVGDGDDPFPIWFIALAVLLVCAGLASAAYVGVNWSGHIYRLHRP